MMSLAGLALLLLTLAAVRVPSARQGFALYAWAAVPEAVAAVRAGVGPYRLELWVAGGLILLVKGLLVPRLAVAAVPASPGRAMSRWAPAWLLLAAAALISVSWRVMAVVTPGPAAGPAALPLAAGLLALGLPAVRYEAWAAAVGLLLAEGAACTLGFVLLPGWPAAADALALADLVALGVLLTVLLRRLAATWGTHDVRLLKELKG